MRVVTHRECRTTDYGEATGYATISFFNGVTDPLKNHTMMFHRAPGICSICDIDSTYGFNSYWCSDDLCNNCYGFAIIRTASGYYSYQEVPSTAYRDPPDEWDDHGIMYGT
jgi:hypothetical protein